MSEETTKTSQEEVSVDDLDTAFRAVEESTEEAPTDEVEEKEEVEVKEEEVEEHKEVPLEPEDNSTRSRLGRKVASLESQVTALMDELRKTRSEPVKEEDEIADNAILTRKDVERLWDDKIRKTNEANQKYSNDYTIAMVQLTNELDDVVFDEVMKEVDTMYGKRNTGRPDIDAQLDYLDSYNHILKKKTASKSNPLDKNKGKDAKGAAVNNANKTTETKKKMPELDPEALDFIKRVGMSPEDVEDALTNKSKTLLVKEGSGMDMGSI